ncbi:uncharacterized protein LAESUDRAFT_179031 [Laetiporus sulphureus 93-53]|uniref:UBA domain-containing protein n=1 Tax=Laetiporus sulphureus 93-53 TaxID=1314785 RepID=A0A165E8G1_9APHY|nr:uncharacterized protein LAESUDRAFT_179031 [Laetiporus sulphureus 93-53]KZT06456.1 hypothetical protein LAESUDRAFT_179031 [Laetiporus sulphureus 93-53]
MSDSFAELWNSTGASKPAEPPRKLGSLAGASPVTAKPQHDAFTMLASAGSTRSNTPMATGGSMKSSLSLRANVSSSSLSAKPVQKAASAGNDAFSGLFRDALPPGSNADNTKMTIAERAAQAERERREQLQRQQLVAKQQATAWAGLDSLGNSSSARPASALTPTQSKGDDWAFDLAPSTSSAPSKPAAPPQDNWGLEEFVSQPASPKPTPLQQSQSLLDLDEFTSPSAVQASRHSPEPLRSNTPGDFDFGEREDGLLDDTSDTEDDILGELGKPVTERSQPSRPASITASAQSSKSGPPSRAVSPPPHILGQIVEMGFSIQQARIALAATDTGLDVQAALETLLSNGAGSETPPPDRPSQGRQTAQREPGYDRYYSSDEDHQSPTSATPVRGPTRSRTQPRNGAPPSRTREPSNRADASPSGGPSEAQRNIQEQADKLLAQASEIGISMFNRANAFWKEGKEKALRAYEERAAVARTEAAASRSRRPRWMQEVADGAEHEEGWANGASAGFEDSHEHGEEVLPPKPKTRTRRSPPREQEPQMSRAAAFKAGNLISDEMTAVYSSPFRRKTPARSQVATPTEPVASSSVSIFTAPAPPRTPSPIPLITRKTVPASPAAIAASAKHKAAGTEMFKLGRYAEAETLYSRAIAALPAAHLLLVPLYNNRALARNKIGDYAGAIEDCSAVVEIVGMGYRPERERRVEREEEGAGVDLGEGLVKALWRRAEAYEGRERWEEARKDWEAVAGVEFAGKVRVEAVKGVGRCKKMLAANANGDAHAPASTGTAGSSASRSNPKPAPHFAKPPRVSVPTEALNRVREANRVAEAEDQARLDLKDVVDARLVAWKNGKESNIRALIASLDMVLWPELEWQKVGMHELVTPAQVKVRYTKAIAKLHPDKLNVNNTTLEQRMIANGVFGSLNDAWNAFKQ